MAAAAMLLLSTRAHAQPTCVVRVTTDARAWRSAATDVEELVHGLPGGDCREILVEPDDHGATVTLTTSD